MSILQWQQDDTGIVELNFAVNKTIKIYDTDFSKAFAKVIDDLLILPNCRGIVFTLDKPLGNDDDFSFFLNTTTRQTEKLFTLVENIKTNLRRLETAGIPIVTCLINHCLNINAEFAFASHHRIAVTNKHFKIGINQVNLGLCPGLGGLVRVVNLLGLEQGLSLLTEGQLLTIEKAQALGIINDSAESLAAALDQAKSWIITHEHIVQPWDQKHYNPPGGRPNTLQLAQKLILAPALYRKKVKQNYPAPLLMLMAATEGLNVDFNTASRIESRYFVKSVTDPVCKNLITTFYKQMNELKQQINRPQEFPYTDIKQLGVIGAGMMGAGIALTAVMKGMQVVLIDTSTEKVEQGKEYTARYADRLLQKEKITTEIKQQWLNAITVSTTLADCYACDLVVEAVYEDEQLKHEIFHELQLEVQPDCIIASNTSTIPISHLAKPIDVPEQFVGIHFFSPVEKMPMIELIFGEQTSSETMAIAYDFALKLGKTPIVVNDSREFYLSKIFGLFIKEGLAMLNSGVPAIMIENAAIEAGYPVGPLAVLDEVSLTLIEHVRKQSIQAAEKTETPYIDHPGDSVLLTMLSLNRKGKAMGAGFYDYSKESKQLWPELSQHFPLSEKLPKLDDLKERFLFVQSLGAAICIEEKTLTSCREANIGAIMGVGYPNWTGGPIQYINQYGIARFVRRARQFCHDYGERFKPTSMLEHMADSDVLFED